MITINIIGVVVLIGSVLGYGALFLWVLAGRNARKTRFQPLDRICDEYRKEERRQDKGYVEGGVRKSYGERERVKERSVCYSERPYPEER